MGERGEPEEGGGEERGAINKDGSSLCGSSKSMGRGGWWSWKLLRTGECAQWQLD
jgi:hypothetical protein